LQGQINQLSAASLEVLAEVFLDFGDELALREWLSQLSKKTEIDGHVSLCPSYLSTFLGTQTPESWALPTIQILQIQ
jgi:hypothetical protein